MPSLQLCVWYEMGIQQTPQEQTWAEDSGTGWRDQVGGKIKLWPESQAL